MLVLIACLRCDTACIVNTSRQNLYLVGDGFANFWLIDKTTSYFSYKSFSLIKSFFSALFLYKFDMHSLLINSKEKTANQKLKN